MRAPTSERGWRRIRTLAERASGGARRGPGGRKRESGGGWAGGEASGEAYQEMRRRAASTQGSSWRRKASSWYQVVGETGRDWKAHLVEGELLKKAAAKEPEGVGWGTWERRPPKVSQPVGAPSWAVSKPPLTSRPWEGVGATVGEPVAGG